MNQNMNNTVIFFYMAEIDSKFLMVHIFFLREQLWYRTAAVGGRPDRQTTRGFFLSIVYFSSMQTFSLGMKKYSDVIVGLTNGEESGFRL